MVFVPICHIFYADDVIIHWNKANMINMFAILHYFSLVVGLKFS